MEKLGGSGDGTSSHLSRTSTYITEPLDTILKDKEILCYEGPTAFESGWKRSSPSVQTSNGQILAHCQRNNESTGSIHRPTGPRVNHGFTAVLPRENYPLNNLQHFCSNDRPPKTSPTGEKVLLQKCPIQLSSSSLECQKASSASTTTNISNQSHMPHMIVLNSNNLSESWKNNLYNQQQHVKISNNLPKDTIGQGLFTDVGRFGVILAQAQTINLRQQNACMPKDIYQQKYAPQKAIAVVTPLTQKAVEGVTFSKNLAKVKEGGLETRSVPNKKDHQPYIPQTFQSTTNECGAKSFYDSTSQTKEVPSKSVLATGISHRLAENNKLPGPCESLSSVPLDSVSVERREGVQLYSTDCNFSAKPLTENEATVMGQNIVGMRMDTRMDRLSTIPVQEWSLQRLRNFMNYLEQMQKRQQKDIPHNDLSSEILKLYWNGDYQKICNAAKSNLYIDIMKEVRLHCGTENSVILQEVSRERLNEIVSSFHILEHGNAPPKMVYTSSWLNLSEKLNYIDEKLDGLPSLMTLHCKKTNIAAMEVPVKEMENVQEPTNEEIKESYKTLSGGEQQRKPLLPENQTNSSVKGDKMERKEPVEVNVENTCSGGETEGQDSMTVKNVIVKRVQSEKPNRTKGENEAPLLVSLRTQSSDVSDGCLKPGTLLLTTVTTPVLDKNVSSDCISDEMSNLPPEKAGEPDVEVDNMQKEDAQFSTDSKGQVIVELLEQDEKRMDVEMKSDERSNKNKINWELENYCCLAKWFQVLGYRNGRLCKCEKIAEVSPHADTSSKGLKGVNADKNRQLFNQACNLTGTDVCVLRDNKQLKNSLEYKTGKKTLTSPAADDASLDELEIVDVITNYEDVLKMANAMSEQLMETSVKAHTKHESKSGRKLWRNRHKEITTAESKTGETLINLTLFGTSHQRQRKNISGLMSSDNVYLPPETINVRISSGWNEYPNSTNSQTPKQQVWNSWKKTYVPSKMSANRKLKKQKRAKALESKTDAVDNPVIKIPDPITNRSEAEYEKSFYFTSAYKQKNTGTDQSKKHSRKKISLTRQEQIRKLKRKKFFASFNLKKRWNYAKHGSKFIKSSFDSAQVINTSKNKLNTGLALNFGVLPESFHISDGSSTIEANQSASADSYSKDKTVMQTKRTWGMSGTWCESPRKKQCLRSTPTLPNTSGISTFQEFKKKYEQKKQRIPT